MKKKAYFKNQIRIIKKTKARFLSIFCIVLLGTAFFAGLRHSPLIMKESVHDYLQTYKWNDLDYIATYGFDLEVVDKVRDINEVDSVDYGFRFDALMSYQEKSNVAMTVYSDDDFLKGVNNVELLEGRVPKKDNECLLDYQYIKGSTLKLNDDIVLENDCGKKKYKIVGIVNDSRYISNLERGTSTLGDGTNHGFILVLNKGNEKMAVPSELFDLHDDEVFYNELRVHLKNSDDLYEFDDDYDDYVSKVNKDIKKVLNSYNKSFYQRIKDDALSNLNDGKEEYEEGLTSYNKGYQEYLDGYKAYQEGVSAYNDGYKQYLAGKEELDNGFNQYENGYKQYLEGKESYNNYLKQVEDYDNGLNACLVGLNNFGGYQQAKLLLNDTSNPYYQQVKQLVDNYELLISQEDNINILRQQLPTIDKSLKDSKEKLDSTYQLLTTNKDKLASSYQEMITSKQLLDNTNKQLANAKKELAKAKEGLDKAKKELAKGEKEIADIEKGKIITLTKNGSAAIISYQGNCQSIAALSVVFPVLFFLVAALVSMTTMTRMVEELRVQNGTFLALGYLKKDVILQYLSYAFLATFFASSLGIILGTYFFPSIIYYLYRIMMFDVGAPTRIVFNLSTCMQTYLISVVIILLVTYLVCNKELKERPAQILRPKAPKLGKRILLERITVIWKRLSFNQKVTMRNIFRYKKRFFMSIIGIAGCTALIVVGFGIKYSVSPLASEQYGKMWIYDGIVNYQDNNLDVRNEFKKQPGIKSTMGIYSKTNTIDKQIVTVEIPSDPKEFSNYIHMKDVKTKEELSLGNNGVYINEKLAELFDKEVGDSLVVTLNDKDYKVKIAGIYQLYFRHYLYMSPAYYKELTNEEITFNSEYFRLNDNVNEDKLTRYCDLNEDITSIQYVRGIAEGFVSQMESLDSVVLILILCAGALAFIVLYNLTNINIQERKSEIATIKVLGFYPKEVYDYVFRENIILSSIGSIVGLFLGKLIHYFIIRTVEVDMAMFIRNVNIRCYIYAVVLTMLFTLLIDKYMQRVLKKIDMVESLKSIE